MKRAALYLRVSTVDQHPETQALDLRQMAAQRGYNIVQEYTDLISGTKARRPGLDDLMRDARRGRFDVVLVWASDRIARSVKHFLTEFVRDSIGESVDEGLLAAFGKHIWLCQYEPPEEIVVAGRAIVFCAVMPTHDRRVGGAVLVIAVGDLGGVGHNDEEDTLGIVFRRSGNYVGAEPGFKLYEIVAIVKCPRWLGRRSSWCRRRRC